MTFTDVYKYPADEEPVTNENEAEEIIQWGANPKDISCHRWIIQLEENEEPIGTCGFHNWDQTNNRVEIGYDLSGSYWRNGITDEALNLMIKSGFGILSHSCRLEGLF